jgi:hypothetical protein
MKRIVLTVIAIAAAVVVTSGCHKKKMTQKELVEKCRMVLNEFFKATALKEGDAQVRKVDCKNRKALNTIFYSEGDTAEFLKQIQILDATKSFSVELPTLNGKEKRASRKPTKMPNGEVYKMPVEPYKKIVITMDGSPSPNKVIYVVRKGDKLAIPVPVLYADAESVRKGMSSLSDLIRFLLSIQTLALGVLSTSAVSSGNKRNKWYRRIAAVCLGTSIGTGAVVMHALPYHAQYPDQVPNWNFYDINIGIQLFGGINLGHLSTWSAATHGLFYPGLLFTVLFLMTRTVGTEKGDVQKSRDVSLGYQLHRRATRLLKKLLARDHRNVR